MNITYFIRVDNNTYSEPCSCASIELSKDGKTYFGGSQWGFHTPSNTVQFINADCNKLYFNSWLSSLGYELIIEEPQM